MGGVPSVIKSLQRDNPQNTWIILGDLGAGSYGKVHRVRHRQSGWPAVRLNSKQ